MCSDAYYTRARVCCPARRRNLRTERVLPPALNLKASGCRVMPVNYERPEHGRAQSTEELSGWPETYLDSSITSAMNPPRNVHGQQALGLWSTHTHWFICQTKTEVVRYPDKYLGRYYST